MQGLPPPVSIEVINAEIQMSVAPDHEATFLKISIRSELKKRPGRWKFNNSLLEDDGDLTELSNWQISTEVN